MVVKTSEFRGWSRSRPSGKEFLGLARVNMEAEFLVGDFKSAYDINLAVMRRHVGGASGERFPPGAPLTIKADIAVSTRHLSQRNHERA